MLKLDLACGQRCKEGFLGVDISPDVGATFVYDLRKRPWPWPNFSVSEVWCAHFLEHLPGTSRVWFMEELWRILVPGGTATIITPYAWSWRALADPTHQWPPIVEQSYLYFNRRWRQDNKLDHYPIGCNFEFKIRHVFAPEVAFPDDDARALGMRHYLGVIDDLECVLTKVA